MTSNRLEQPDSVKNCQPFDVQFNWINYYPTPALIADKSLQIMHVNEAFSKLTGYLTDTLPLHWLKQNISPEILFEPEAQESLSPRIIPINTSFGFSIDCCVSVRIIQIPDEENILLFFLSQPSVHQDIQKDLQPTAAAGINNGTNQQQASFETQLRAYIFNTAELLIETDHTGKITLINENPNQPAFLVDWIKKATSIRGIFSDDEIEIQHAETTLKNRPAEVRSKEIAIAGKKKTLEYRLIQPNEGHTLVAIRDITEIKQTADALSEIQARLKQAERLSSVGSWDVIFDDVTRINTWHFPDLLGIGETGSEISMDDLYHFELIHKDDIGDYQKFLEKVKSKKLTSYRYDYRIVDAQKSTRYIHTESKLEYNSDGHLQKWSGTLQDITYQKKAENLQAAAYQISQLMHSEHNLSPVMLAIHQIINTLLPAPNLTIALTNDKDGKLTFPYSVDPTKNSNTKDADNGLIGYVLKSGEPLLVSASAIDLMVQEKIIGKPSVIPESWLGVPLKTHEQVVGVMTIQSYSQEVIYGEEEKNILTFVSEQVALSILRIRADEALIKAKNEAEDSSRLKSSLLANMSHELRTPMTGILGFSEILNEELEDDRLKVMASTIYKSATRLMSTLNSIMDLSAIESNIDSLKIIPTGIKTIFLPLLRNLHTLASDKGLYLRTALPPNLFVMADEKLLSQMLFHLLDNAIKFTIDGGVSVSAFTNDSNKGEIIIKVSDTGIGIADEHHKLIFEEFRQVSEGLSRTFEGSGLGLALCSKIARLIKARLWVDSTPDKGSDFYIALPAAVSEQVSEQTEAASGPLSTHRLSRGPVPEVLIVEDNEINRRLAALYLRELCNTEMAENGYVALEKMKRKKYDAILMDINLGAGPNGISVAKQVRLLENYKDTPIIAVTGYTMQGDREKLLSNGCTHYLAKPYDKKTLLRLFSGILYS